MLQLSRRKAPVITGALLATIENHLIELLPLKDHLRLLTLCDRVELNRAEVLYEPDQPTSYAYFPTEAVISLMVLINGSPGVEVGMVGREGMLGTHLALGARTSTLRAVVQGQGAAWRICAVAFREELEHSRALRRGLDRYLSVLMVQLATSAGCQRFHQVAPRLARWLLMSQDRCHSDRFWMTQDFISVMLGVRREGVTQAAEAFRSAGLIDYRRGDIKVLDRAGLEAAACGCYAADRRAYSELDRQHCRPSSTLSAMSTLSPARSDVDAALQSE